MTSLISNAFDKLDHIVEQSRCDRFFVGFSGGVDSSVLLHLAKEYAGTRGLEVRAVHIDHRLQPDSAQWVEHCRRVADHLAVAFETVALDGKVPRGASMEEWAREERYRIFRSMVDGRTCVLTAHHLDDHVETLLYRALRGAGPHGLSGIRPMRRFYKGFLARPLLDSRKRDLELYAKSEGMEWIEDPSNRDERHARNYLRRRIVPMLEQGFPGAVENLRQTAGLQAELANVLDRIADRALDASVCRPSQLDTATLLQFEPELRPFVLKRWLVRAGGGVPGRRHLAQIFERMLPAREDAGPLVRWKECQLRRYRDRLYLMRDFSEQPGHETTPWDLRTELRFPWGSLSTRPAPAEGLDSAVIKDAAVSVGFRGGGERCHPAARTHSQKLKKLFQEWQVPPWERDLTPLIFVGDHLAAVGSHCICRGFGAEAGAVELVWDLNIYTMPHGHS